MKSVVAYECRMSLATVSGEVPVRARLSYRVDDPYAVHIAFHTGREHPPVSWVFARDLLAEGTVSPSGQGDVRVWPAWAGQRGVLNLALSSFDGNALLYAPLTLVAQWLERTYQLVPAGREELSLDLDGELSQLLGEVA